MIGAIIGDIIGSTYEFHNTRNYDFELFPQGSSFTDDTICTIAVADAILRGIPYRDSILEWCRKYPHPKGAYGASFSRWIYDPQPYDSFGNGAAMRVSAIGWAFKTYTETVLQAIRSAECSHSHDEGKRGAGAIASCIYILRTKHWEEAKDEVKAKLIQLYGEDYIDRLPKVGEWDETCQGCVPLAIHLFLQSESFEDAIRKAISYGGDSDTLGAIVGSLAGAFYEIPQEITTKALLLLPDEMKIVVGQFIDKYDPHFKYAYINDYMAAFYDKNPKFS